MTSSRSARRARRNGRQPRPVPALRTASYDATTIEFAGASGTGLPEPGPDPGWDEPGAWFRAPARYQPPAARYAATTGPIPALSDRPAVSIGDALTRDDRWGPKLAPLPCGHCGTPPPVPAGILERTRIIGHVNWLARQAGWTYDTDIIWTCPSCQQDAAWKARQGQMELRLDGPPDAKVSPSGTCDRHDAPPWPDVDPDECRCTCPGAVVAVDVMLASEDHLGSGRSGHRAVTR